MGDQDRYADDLLTGPSSNGTGWGDSACAPIQASSMCPTDNVLSRMGEAADLSRWRVTLSTGYGTLSKRSL